MVEVVLGVRDPNVFSGVKLEHDKNVITIRAPTKSRARKIRKNRRAASGIVISQKFAELYIVA
jgi:hypothetical protein